MNEDVTTRKS